MTSVIELPNYYNLYSDVDAMNDIPNIVTSSVTAYKDINGTALPLVLGASGNMVIESVQDINNYMGVSNAYTISTSMWNDLTKTRTDKEILRVLAATSDITYFSTPSNVVISPVDSATSFITLGSATVSEDGVQQVFSTTLNNFKFAQGVAVAGDVAIANNLYTTGNIYGANVNVWADKENKPYSRVGYGLRINSNDQLEIVKYSKFNDRDVLKRVAVFGQNAFGSNDVSDNSSNYLVFNNLGVGVASSDGSLNPIAAVGGGGPATSGTNMTLSGMTTLAGPLVPSTSTAVVGTSNMFLAGVYTSNLVFPTSTVTVNGASLLQASYLSGSTSNAPTVAALSNAMSNAYGIMSTLLPKAGGILSGSLEIEGDFVVRGTTTTINSTTLTVADNTILLNSSLSNGTPPVTLQSGIEVRRGAEQSYLFVFDEQTDYFKVGMSNSLQAVCTRNDVMSSGYAYFDSNQQKLINRTLQYTDVTNTPWTFINNSSNNSNIYFGTASNGPNVAIGTSNVDPLYKLSVNGQIYAADDITAFSDRRVKTDFQLIGDALDKVKRLNGYTFKRVDHSDDKRYVGVIAQEMQEVLPEVVYEDSRGYLSVAYQNTVALLIEAIKELNVKVDKLTPAAA